MKIPAMASYSKPRYEFVVGTKVTTGAPSVRNIVTRWYLDAGVFLPDGLEINEETGEISGIPTDILDMTSFTVYGENSSGATSTTVTFNIRKGYCMAEGVFPVTEVNTVATYECAMQGSYIGTQTRACKLGEFDGEWDKAVGACISIVVIVVSIVLAIIILVVVVMIIVRSVRKAKAVGGVKGKKASSKSKSSKSTKTLPKKDSSKTIKI